MATPGTDAAEDEAPVAVRPGCSWRDVGAAAAVALVVSRGPFEPEDWELLRDISVAGLGV